MSIIKGIILGVGIVIPGVSGGALAIVFGIYHDLIEAIGHYFSDMKKYFKFLFPIGLGVVIGIFVFSALIQFLLDHYLSPTNFFFIGLIIGGIPSILKSAKFKQFKVSNLLVYICTVMLIIFMSSVQKTEQDMIFTTLNIQNIFRLFIGGVLGAGTMVIPGASGAVMLILLGLYGTVLNAVVEFNVLLMIPFGVGALVGLVLISRMVEKLFAHFPLLTYSGILGLLTGSIYMLVPPGSVGSMGFMSLSSLFLGITIAFVLDNIKKA
ncbi:MAG: DUF368 domain-containing protein [Turicibacter sp.]